MKNTFTALVIMGFLLTGLAVGAQEKVDLESLVVKDSSGAVYAQDAWLKLVSSGQYLLRLSQDKKTATLVRAPAASPVRAEQAPAATPSTHTKPLAGSAKPRESSFFVTGTKIASFNQRDINGERFNLKELLGKVVVLNFWFINCPPCRQEIPHLNEMVETYKNNQEVVFIAIALDEKYSLVEFLKETPFKYHVVPDGQFTTRRYDINLFPTHVVVDKEGKVAFHTSGYSSLTVSGIRSAIETALKGGSTQ
jgi:thiol-disulfide isomerase/thioredoxin